jgi:hypothetical protein
MYNKTKNVKPEKRFIVKDQQSLDMGDILK